MTDTTQMAERKGARLSGGAFPAWPLPPDRTAAAAARAIVRAVFGEPGFPSGAVDDAQTIISELAANAILHGGGERVEVWAYISRHDGPHVTLKVFDAAPWRGPVAVPAADPSDSCGGRGLMLVGALTEEIGGRWGVHSTRSRLGPDPVPGKAAYFTVPLPEKSPAATPPASPGSAHVRICALAEARGLRPLVSLDPDSTVVHFAKGLWVWQRGDSLLYDRPGHGVVRHPVTDVVEVVEQIVRYHEESATPVMTPYPPSSSAGHAAPSGPHDSGADRPPTA